MGVTLRAGRARAEEQREAPGYLAPPWPPMTSGYARPADGPSLGFSPFSRSLEAADRSRRGYESASGTITTGQMARVAQVRTNEPRVSSPVEA